MLIFIWYDQSWLHKFVIAFLLLELIKIMVIQLFYDGGLCHKEPSLLICSANEWTSLYMIGTSAMNQLTKKV